MVDKNTKTQIQFWTKEYKRIQNSLNQLLYSKENILTAFNINIDAIIPIEEILPEIKQQLTNLDETKLKQKIKQINSINIISSEKDFFTALIYALYTNEELELKINEKIRNKLRKYKPKERSIGGQAGISAQFLSTITSPSIFSTTLSKQLTETLNNNIKILYKGKLLTKQEYIKIIENKKINHKTNYIIEYPKNLDLKLFKTKKSNRIIFSSLNPDKQYFGTHLKHFKLRGIDKLFLSGYQHITKKTKKDIKTISNELKQIKRINPFLKIHIEDAHISNKIIKRAIIKKIWKHADSIGLNEFELRRTLKTLNYLKYYSFNKNIYDLHSTIKCLRYLIKKTKTHRISLHTHNYQITAIKNHLLVNPYKIRDYQLLSYLIASYAAQENNYDFKKNISKLKAELNYESIGKIIDLLENKNIKEIDTGIVKYKDIIYIITPSYKAKNIKKTVGLGDIISSLNYYYY